MSNETPTLSAETRERTGTRYAQRLRQAGRLPAVVYGHGADPLSISVDRKSTLEMLERGSRVFDLDVAGTHDTVLVKDIQFGYLGDDVIHLDLTRVNLDEKVTVNVAITFVGQPEAASKPGAVLGHDHTELTVTCSVRDIPDEIKVDISGIESHMTASEVALPAGVELVEEAKDWSIASITFVAEEAEGEAAGVEGEGEGQPEVIGASDDEGAEESKGD